MKLKKYIVSIDMEQEITAESKKEAEEIFLDSIFLLNEKNIEDFVKIEEVKKI